MMRPQSAGAWWTAAMFLGLLSGGLAIATFDIRTPMGWLAIGLALAAIACVVMAVRVNRTGS